jgi:hypothetical protein
MVYPLPKILRNLEILFGDSIKTSGILSPDYKKILATSEVFDNFFSDVANKTFLNFNLLFQ